jgi:glycosyltransferase involved in cell wall biosynthesis
MRVCFITFDYPPKIIGGTGTYAETLVKGLKSEGVDLFLITRGFQSDIGQRTYRVPSSNSRYWRRLFFIKSALSLFDKLNKLWKFDVVHFNEPHVMLKKPKISSVCTFHSTQVNEMKLKLADINTLKTVRDIEDLVLKSSVGSVFDVFTAHAADKIICPSPHLTELVKSYCLVDERKVCCIPNGIDFDALDKIDDDPASILSKYDLKKDNYVLFIGRLSSLKGVQYLIDAFKVIKKDYITLKLVIVGAGDFEGYLKNLSHGIRGIVFTGHIDSLNVRTILYRNCAFVVVPSLYEGLPIVVLEAMACGKAVVASGVGGIPLLIRHGQNGFLTKPGDSEGLEKFIRLLLENANLRENMGAFGRKLVEKDFSVDRMVCDTLKVYDSLS